MRKASRVLGIVGGSVCLLSALALGLIMILEASFSGFEFYDDTLRNMSFAQGASAYSALDPMIRETIVSQLPYLICSFVAGALGITGGVLVRKKNIVSGILFIIAAGTCVGCFNIPSMICLILAAIFAFVKEKPKPINPYYPYPPYPYYPAYGMPGYGPGGAPQGMYPQPPYGQLYYGQYPPYPSYPPQPPYGQQPPQPAPSVPQDAPAPVQEGEHPQPQEVPNIKMSAPGGESDQPER